MNALAPRLLLSVPDMSNMINDYSCSYIQSIPVNGSARSYLFSNIWHKNIDHTHLTACIFQEWSSRDHFNLPPSPHTRNQKHCAHVLYKYCCMSCEKSAEGMSDVMWTLNRMLKSTLSSPILTLYLLRLSYCPFGTLHVKHHRWKHFDNFISIPSALLWILILLFVIECKTKYCLLANWFYCLFW